MANARDVDAVVNQRDTIGRTLLGLEFLYHLPRVAEQSGHMAVEPPLERGQNFVARLIAVQAAPAHHARRHAGDHRKRCADQIGSRQEEVGDLRPRGNHDPKQLQG